MTSAKSENLSWIHGTNETVPRTFLFFRICLAKIKILLTFASLTASVFWRAKGHQCEQDFLFFFFFTLYLPFLVLKEWTAIIDRSTIVLERTKVGTKQLLYLCNYEKYRDSRLNIYIYIYWYVWDWRIQYYNITSFFCDSYMKYFKVKKLTYY